MADSVDRTRAVAHPNGPAETGSPGGRYVRVWDVPVRLFHGGLLLCVTMAALTGFFFSARWVDVHVLLGAAAAALVALRIVWGFTGTTHARFADFVRGPRAVAEHLRGLVTGSTGRHLGHNPAGGWMMLALGLTILMLAATGAMVLGGTLKAGPFASAVSFDSGEAIRDLHEALAIALLGLIGLHVVAAVVESVRTAENLPLAMVTGRKRAAPETAPAADRAQPWLALAIIIPAGLATALVLTSMAQRPMPGLPDAPLDAAYVAECGACHIAYHPSLLPRASWQTLMGTLDDHFGENAALPDPAARSIAAYLDRNAAEAFDTRAANLFRTVSPSQPLQVTASPAWRAIHASVGDAVFAARDVGGRGNCSACHPDAAAGRFYPGSIAIPTEKP